MVTPRDNNRITAKMGVLYSDGKTLVPIAIDAGGNMLVDTNNLTLGATAPLNALRDEDRDTVLMGVSSVDGITPIPVFVTALGRVLVDS